MSRRFLPKGIHSGHKEHLKLLPSLDAPQKRVAALLNLDIMRSCITRCFGSFM